MPASTSSSIFMSDAHAFFAARELAHDGLHAGEDFLTALEPVGGCCNRLRAVGFVAIQEQVVAGESGREFRGSLRLADRRQLVLRTLRRKWRSQRSAILGSEKGTAGYSSSLSYWR